MAKVKVEINCKQIFEFSQFHEIEEADYNKLKDFNEVSEKDDREEYSILEGIINPHDVFDTERVYTDFDIRLNEPKASKEAEQKK